MTRLLLPRGYKNAETLHKRLHVEPEEHWIHRGEQRALHLFRLMAGRVPAYKDFLKAHRFSPYSVHGYEDFHKIPAIDKDNYLRKYPKEMMCWDGEFSGKQWVISTTSGSTGEPYYFPRESSQDWQYAITAELYLRSNFHIHERSTLYIVAFPMGAWIGGLFTYEALKIIADNGDYKLSIITPGIHKKEVISAVKQLGSSFDQVIIGAYAPFLKDILDDGVRAGIKWSDYNLGFVFSAEGFTEKFRDYVFRETGITDKLRGTLNHYGTVDLGTMAHETPEAILIRRELVSARRLSVLFPEIKRQPTFGQYNPELFHFEDVDHDLFCTAYSGLPLVRYDLKDYGGVMTRQEVHRRMKEADMSVNSSLGQHRIKSLTWNLPFVYVYERNDFSVSYYAFLIYPDMVRRALQVDKVSKKITGKFTMIVNYDEDGRQRLNIHIETKPEAGDKEALKSELQDMAHAALLRESSEYQEVERMIGDDIKPIIHLWDYEDPTFFRTGVKQKWVIK